MSNDLNDAANESETCKTPKYVTSFLDKYGKRRYRFQKQGVKSVYLPHPNDPKFYEEYAKATLGMRPTKPPCKVRQKAISYDIINDALLIPMIEENTEEWSVRIPESIYIIMDSLGRIKVGKTVRPRKRILQIRRHINDPNVVMLARFDVSNFDAYRIETCAHKILQSYEIGNEWFDCTFHLAEMAVRISIATFGEAFNTQHHNLFVALGFTHGPKGINYRKTWMLLDKAA